MPRLDRDKYGKLRKYAWPGGYLISFLTENDEVLCHRCASDRDGDKDLFDYEYPVSGFVNWESDHLYCDECSKEIPPEYELD